MFIDIHCDEITTPKGSHKLRGFPKSKEIPAGSKEQYDLICFHFNRSNSFSVFTIKFPNSVL